MVKMENLGRKEETKKQTYFLNQDTAWKILPLLMLMEQGLI